jgi:hypothetical protein
VKFGEFDFEVGMDFDRELGGIDPGKFGDKFV